LASSIGFGNLSKSNLRNFHQVVAGKIESLKGRGVTECPSWKTPEIVVSKIEDRKIVKILERVHLDLHGHAAGPFRIVALNLEAFQTIEANEGSGGYKADLAEVNGEVTEAWETSKMIRA